jgi:DNA-binding transcriptional regulator YiaG
MYEKTRNIHGLEVVSIKKDARPAVDWIFRGKVAAKKKEHALTWGDLKDMTGIPEDTLRSWSCGRRDPDYVADALARVLDIER